MKLEIFLKVRHLHILESTRCKSNSCARRLAVVGSGPAGFYSVQSLLKRWPSCSVDLYEKLPVPYGLVRYGVAPDHPEVKNCIHQFEKTVEEFGPLGRFQFFGNVNVGKDVRIRELAESYDAVLLAYGSETEKKLGIEGEDARNCFSARHFVGWYNGSPDAPNLDSNLAHLRNETAVILGHGNVALDAARILLAPESLLNSTDISSRAIDQLKRSKIRRVILIGRRGPLQVSFTIAELREMTRLAGCGHVIDKLDFKAIEESKILDRLDRPRKRLTQLMMDKATNLGSGSSENDDKRWILKFLRTPKRILSTENAVSGIELVENCLELDGDNYSEAKAIPLEHRRTESIPCSLILYSIGYRSINIDPDDLPFDQKRCVISTENFKVNGAKNIYACGWCATGARGVIASTQSQSRMVAEKIIADFSSSSVDGTSRPGFENVETVLRRKNNDGKEEVAVAQICHDIEENLLIDESKNESEDRKEDIAQSKLENNDDIRKDATFREKKRSSTPVESEEKIHDWLLTTVNDEREKENDAKLSNRSYQKIEDSEKKSMQRATSMVNLSDLRTKRSQLHTDWFEKKKQLLKQQKQQQIILEEQKEKLKREKENQSRIVYESWKKLKDEQIRIRRKIISESTVRKEREEKESKEQKRQDALKVYEAWKKSKEALSKGNSKKGDKLAEEQEMKKKKEEAKLVFDQ
uniref:NADPH:adrenodoxin oxidoreductase, mitochondrial n=1 Tax=Romanomermis culicivorax TaxID=13658 RepID=A0A915JIF5_ROMCU